MLMESIKLTLFEEKGSLEGEDNALVKEVNSNIYKAVEADWPCFAGISRPIFTTFEVSAWGNIDRAITLCKKAPSSVLTSVRRSLCQ